MCTCITCYSRIVNKNSMTGKYIAYQLYAIHRVCGS